MPLSQSDFDYVRTLVHKGSAIVLENDKTYLAESRLQMLARREGYGSANDLVAELRASRSKNGLQAKVVEAMTTNETSFFRDVQPFEALRKVVLPDLFQRRANERTLHIWSAACSTGQEPYSIVMLLREHFREPNWNVRILATDLSRDVLDRARNASYSQLEVNRGLPAHMLVRYFERHGNDWCLKDDIRKAVEFRELNLIEPWQNMPQFDVVMLRNVLIYFDVETKKQILAKVRRLLRSDGYLFLGGAETTMNLDSHFQRVNFDRSGCYRLTD